MTKKTSGQDDLWIDETVWWQCRLQWTINFKNTLYDVFLEICRVKVIKIG